MRVAFKHYPLPIHPKARGASNAAMCAHEQNPKSFWKLHDLMFAQQSDLGSNALSGLAKKAGLDMKKFEQCMKANKYAAHVEKDLAQGKEIGVRSTPTFFINGRIISGAQPLEVFEEEIRRHL